ncbi:MAG: putative WcaK-like polysaccharide pyruvyl transferase [Terrestrivirus sp.]|uniref:Putative WcaK-like polysaccharide pyruvyl transferase n=1 Tax=Terrestrivirus sp. TaxID=2487775 RepID=A0A3G4ZLG6_9VIRU|nr:MAG: putative WcaK-like polysaccharide pyruvyl transferase [Terrestrivirus sp.]
MESQNNDSQRTFTYDEDNEIKLVDYNSGHSQHKSNVLNTLFGTSADINLPRLNLVSPLQKNNIQISNYPFKKKNNMQISSFQHNDNSEHGREEREREHLRERLRERHDREEHEKQEHDREEHEKQEHEKQEHDREEHEKQEHEHEHEQQNNSTGCGTGSGSGSDTGTGSGSNTGTGTGSGSNTGTGTGSGSNTGTVVNNDIHQMYTFAGDYDTIIGNEQSKNLFEQTFKSSISKICNISPDLINIVNIQSGSIIVTWSIPSVTPTQVQSLYDTVNNATTISSLTDDISRTMATALVITTIRTINNTTTTTTTIPTQTIFSDTLITLLNIIPEATAIVKKINLNYIDHAKLDNYHRAGWTFLLNIIQNIQDNGTDLIFDDYMDATFLWERNILIANGKIPYKTNWIGVLHHPPNQTYSINNATNIINDPVFQQSLSNCKGIICLSKYLQSWLQTNLINLGFNNVNVYYLCHPTLFVTDMFTVDNFNANTSKQIVQIGGWLRDSYAIYKLYINNTNITKTYLKSVAMDFYFKPANFDFNQIASIASVDSTELVSVNTSGLDSLPSLNISGLNITNISNLPNTELTTLFSNIAGPYDEDYTPMTNISGNPLTNISDSVITNISGNNVITNISGNVITITPTQNTSNISGTSIIIPNKYIAGMISSLLYNDANVTITSNVSNAGYDTLLSQNVVFLYLVDASACNTLIECVVRNTPIVINKLPAVVEILGDNYPLYYSSIEEASFLTTSLVDPNNLLMNQAYNYLNSLDKTNLRITTFIQGLYNIINAIN